MYEWIIEKQWRIICKIQFRMQQEIGVENAMKHYKEVDDEIMEKMGDWTDYGWRMEKG